MIAGAIPHFMPRKSYNQMCDNSNKTGNMFLSNLAGPLKEPWVFKGNKVDWVILASVVPTLGPAVSMVTHHECSKVAVIADIGEFSETKQLLDRIVHELTPPEARTEEIGK